MLKQKKILSIISFLLLNIFVITTSTIAQEEKISPTLEKGIGQYKHENFDEAESTLKKAREEDPKSSLAAYYLGLNYKQLQEYEEAIPNLRDAVTYQPKIKGALVELIDSLYQIGELEEAKKWLAEAEDEGIRPAQTAFLKGLVYLKDGDSDTAVSGFEDAKALDKSMATACDYQIGVCHLKNKQFSDARRAFEQVVIVDPNANIANFANEYIDAIEKKEDAMRPFRFSAGVAWQYDDNVILKPSDTALASSIADQGDSREVYTAKAEYNQRFLDDKFGLKGQYMLYVAKQNDLGFYDVLSNTFVIQPSIYFENGFLSFPTAYNHTCVNDKAYVSSPTTSGIYSFMVGKKNMGQVFLKYSYKDYLWTPSTDDENRDGSDFGGGAGWYFFYAKNKGFLSVRYSINQQWADGANWEFIGNRANVTLVVPGSMVIRELENLNLTLSGDINVQNFKNTHSVYGQRRADQVYTVSALIAYKFYKDSEIQLQYTFIKDSSNISVYDYKRNLYSVGMEFKF